VSRRPTVGFLTRRIWDSFSIPLWRGVLDACREGDADVVTFAGTNLITSRRLIETQGYTVYDLADPENVDGLVVSASSLSSFIGKDALTALYKRFGSLPIVNIALEFEGRPTVLVDNYGGMRELMAHILDVHGRRRPVFLPGPWENDEVRERYRAYMDVLSERGLPVDRGLIAPAGLWDWNAGRQSMQSFLDGPRTEFDAVIAASDGLAVGAMELLKERGIAVPQQVSVTGFNDSPEALLIEPPLTTVQQPIYQLSRKATDLLISVLRGREVARREVLPTFPAIRRSCGCAETDCRHSPEEPESNGGRTAKIISDDDKKHIAGEITRVMKSHADVIPDDWAVRLLDSFFREMAAPASCAFRSECEATVRRLSAADRFSDELHEVLTAIRDGLARLLEGADMRKADSVLLEARIAASDAAGLLSMRRSLIKTSEHNLAFEIETAMDSAVDKEGLIEALVQKLPEMNIKTCFVATYENPLAPAIWAKPAVIYREGSITPIGEPSARFASKRLLPDSFLPEGKRRALLVLPLCFQASNIGFSVFEVGTVDGEAYEIVRQELCGTLSRISLLELREQARTSLERLVQERTAQLSAEIAERKGAEEALIHEQYLMRSLMENVPDFIYFKDTRSRFIRINGALALHFGLPNPGDCMGKSDSDYYSREFAEKTLSDERRVMETGLPLIGIEENETWPDGRQTWTSSTKLPLRGGDGTVVGIMGISRDITETKKVEAELKLLNDRLEERVRQRTTDLETANRELEAFSYSVSHDLRAPLRTMFGFARILQEDHMAETGPEVARLLSAIIESSRQMERLIDGLLSFFRFSRQAVSHQSVSMADLVSEALESLRSETNGRRVEIVTGDIPGCHGDPILLRQVWSNLIANALKFTRKREGARIEIGSSRKDGKSVYHVKDNGVGFDMKYADKLFRVFQRLHRSEDFEGTGIGLATVQRIIHRHGGRIWVEAEAGRGAAFYFTVAGG
jgi:PAS domain S-box-containing protein